MSRSRRRPLEISPLVRCGGVELPKTATGKIQRFKLREPASGMFHRIRCAAAGFTLEDGLVRSGTGRPRRRSSCCMRGWAASRCGRISRRRWPPRTGLRRAGLLPRRLWRLRSDPKLPCARPQTYMHDEARDWRCRRCCRRPASAVRCWSATSDGASIAADAMRAATQDHRVAGAGADGARISSSSRWASGQYRQGAPNSPTRPPDLRQTASRGITARTSTWPSGAGTDAWLDPALPRTGASHERTSPIRPRAHADHSGRGRTSTGPPSSNSPDGRAANAYCAGGDAARCLPAGHAPQVDPARPSTV